MNIAPFSDVIGGIAALLTTVSFVPQVWQSYRTRDLSSISLPMYALFTAGVGMWLLYGWLTTDWPVILANAATFCLALIVLILKVIDKQ